MNNCKAIATPLVANEKLPTDAGDKLSNPTEYRSLIGCLLYICSTRPEIMFSVSYLSRFMQQPCKSYFTAAKRLLRYLKGTSSYCVKFTRSDVVDLVAFSDSDWGSCIDDAKSTSGYIFTLVNGVFSWNSHKQESVAQSSAEAEYVAAANAANQALWLRKVLIDLGIPQTKPTKLFVDNQSAISISQNPIFHERTKHIHMKYHALRDAQKKGEILVQYCCSVDQVVDIMTKVLHRAKFELNRGMLMVKDASIKEGC